MRTRSCARAKEKPRLPRSLSRPIRTPQSRAVLKLAARVRETVPMIQHTGFARVLTSRSGDPVVDRRFKRTYPTTFVVYNRSGIHLVPQLVRCRTLSQRVRGSTPAKGPN